MLYAFAGSFAVGIALASLSAHAVPLAPLALFLSALLFAHAFLRAGGARAFYAAPLVLLGLGAGLLRAAPTDAGSEALDEYLGRKVTLVGLVASDADVRERASRVVVDSSSVRERGRETPAEARVIASVPSFPELRYGDTVLVEGTLSRPSAFETEEGKEFDYPGFLAKDGIYYELGYAKAEIASRGGGDPTRRALFAFRRSVMENVSDALPEPQSSLANGVLLGAKRSLGDELLDDLKRSGLSHVVVLSGYNIAIVSGFALRAFSALPLAGALAGAAASIVLFSLMVGGSASVARAAVMALVALLARATGRKYDALRALAIAAVAMLAHEPRILMDDPSFQLSFLASLAVIGVSPLAERRLGFITKRYGLRELVAASVSTQAFVAPFLLHMTGNVSLVSLAANVAALPAVPLAMAFSALTAAAAYASGFLALVPGVAAYALLSYVLGVARAAASLPFASVAVSVPGWLIALFYAGSAFLVFRPRPQVPRDEPKRWDTSLAYEIVEI